MRAVPMSPPQIRYLEKQARNRDDLRRGGAGARAEREKSTRRRDEDTAGAFRSPVPGGF